MPALDPFKNVNGPHGHGAGDRALRLVARLLAGTGRSGELAGRLGGKEFGVLLGEASAAELVAVPATAPAWPRSRPQAPPWPR